MRLTEWMYPVNPPFVLTSPTMHKTFLRAWSWCWYLWYVSSLEGAPLQFGSNGWQGRLPQLIQHDLIVKSRAIAAYHFFNETNAPRGRTELWHSSAKDESLALKHIHGVFRFEGVKHIKLGQFRFGHAVVGRKYAIHVRQENVIPQVSTAPKGTPIDARTALIVRVPVFYIRFCRLLGRCRLNVAFFYAIVLCIGWCWSRSEGMNCKFRCRRKWWNGCRSL